MVFYVSHVGIWESLEIFKRFPVQFSVRTVISSKTHAFIASVSQNWYRCGQHAFLPRAERDRCDKRHIFRECQSFFLFGFPRANCSARNYISLRIDFSVFFCLRIVLLHVDYTFVKRICYSVIYGTSESAETEVKRIVHNHVYKLRGTSFEADRELKLWKKITPLN